MIGSKRHSWVIVGEAPGRENERENGCKLYLIRCEKCGAEKVLPTFRFKVLGKCQCQKNTFSGMTRKRRIRDKSQTHIQPMSKEQFRRAVLRDQYWRRLSDGYTS